MPNDTTTQGIPISVVLSKKVDDVIYNLMVRTITDQVYQGEHTLSEILYDIQTLLKGKAEDSEFRKVKKKLNLFLEDAPEDFQTIMDIYNYINSKGEETDTKFKDLEKILTQKVSTEVYNKDKAWCAKQIETIKKSILDLSKDCITNEVFEVRLQQLEESIRADMNRNILASKEIPENLIDGGFWIQTL